MEETKKNLFVKVSQIAIVIILLLSVALNVYLLTKEKDVEIVEKVVTEIKHDTITDTVPKVVSKVIVRYKKIPVYITDTVKGDTVFMDLPIEQRCYTDDSTYKAYVSGHEPNLDSINVFRKTIYTEKTITIKEKDKRKFIFGPTINAGYDPKNKQVGYSIGFGVTWSLFGF